MVVPYFLRLGLPANAKIGIDGLTGAFSPKLTSHKASWPALLRNQLRHLGYESVTVLTTYDHWSDYEVILLDLGMEFKGTFNLFGGASDDLAYRLNQLVNYEGILLCAHQALPDLGAFVRSRLATGSQQFQRLNAQALTEVSAQVIGVTEILTGPRLVLGDSHALSAYHPGYRIHRHDGLTLHGALQRGLRSLVPTEVTNLVIYLGNIDVRHHLMRQPDSISAAKELVREYERQLEGLNLTELKVVTLLPIEHEERRLPKSGYYKDQPFFGTQQQRHFLKELLNEELLKMCFRNGWASHCWPEGWHRDLTPAEYAERHMERPGSVHLARHSYIYNFDTNQPNHASY